MGSSATQSIALLLGQWRCILILGALCCFHGARPSHRCSACPAIYEALRHELAPGELIGFKENRSGAHGANITALPGVRCNTPKECAGDWVPSIAKPSVASCYSARGCLILSSENDDGRHDRCVSMPTHAHPQLLHTTGAGSH